jgi:DNA/RNA endonuclease YhcR with UshA esterase domain
MRPNTRGVLLAALLGLVALPCAAAPLSPDEARQHVGQSATVCGTVASAHYALPSQTTFLNFDKPYPHQPFTAVIFRGDRSKFGTPEKLLRGKRVCVSGPIRLYRGVPEIVLDNPAQLTQ